MTIHPDFPPSPHSILNPDIRWFPADKALSESSYDKLLPPLVHVLRKKVKARRARRTVYTYRGGTFGPECLPAGGFTGSVNYGC